MEHTKLDYGVEVRQSKTDDVKHLQQLLNRLRRKVSRMGSFELLPEEIVVRLEGHILQMLEDLNGYKA